MSELERASDPTASVADLTFVVDRAAWLPLQDAERWRMLRVVAANPQATMELLQRIVYMHRTSTGHWVKEELVDLATAIASNPALDLLMLLEPTTLRNMQTMPHGYPIDDFWVVVSGLLMPFVGRFSGDELRLIADTLGRTQLGRMVDELSWRHRAYGMGRMELMLMVRGGAMEKVRTQGGDVVAMAVTALLVQEFALAQVIARQAQNPAALDPNQPPLVAAPEPIVRLMKMWAVPVPELLP